MKYSNEKIEKVNIFLDLGVVLAKNCTKFENEIEEAKECQNDELYEMSGKKLGRIKEECQAWRSFLLNICQDLKEK